LAQLLIAGGAGFIGSHTCLVLLEAGHDLVVLDSYRNSSTEALRRVAALAGQASSNARLTVIEGDIRSSSDLKKAFSSGVNGQPIEAVVHFAGLKAVGESVREPLLYWDVNMNGSRCLLQCMQSRGCRTMVFSSSATLYGLPEEIPIPETAPIRPINPYGHTKAAVEQMLADLAASEPDWRIANLRYFNPVGAHPSGCIGEDPQGVPNNLFPFITQVAVGRRQYLQIYGGDWPTKDGSGVRDYIHVMDLAEGHQAALAYLLNQQQALITLNLGSGQGHSVIEVLEAFEKESGLSIPYQIVDRRPGDAAVTVAKSELAAQILGWRSKRGLKEICRDGWNWQRANPDGYKV
jgi:UDP-glucose 4-epimerase